MMIRLRVVSVALCSLAFAACGSSNGGTSSEPDVIVISDGGADVGDGDAGSDAFLPDPCSSNADCRGGEVCRGGFCVESCGPDNPCSGALAVCDEEAGICVGCIDDGDCALDQVCDATSRTCVDPECIDYGDCPGGFACVGGACSPIDDIVCESLSTRCEGNTLYTCSRDGTRDEATARDAGDVCVDDGAAAACRPLICTPNEVSCVDGSTAGLCDATGTVVDAFACRDDQFCDAGVCSTRVCEAGARSCEGDVAVTCDALGASATTTVCADTEACVAGAFGCACVAGDCVVRTCTPGASQCVGNPSRTCNDAGTGWLPPTDCGADGLCIEGTCLDVLCGPSAVECAGESLATCDADGTTRELVDCAAGGRVCVESGGSAACSDRVCEPLSARCAAGREVVLTCDARGAGEAERACTATQFCSAGACLPQVCTPGAGPTCRDGDRYTCDARGTGWTLTEACADDAEICRDGACVDVVCDAGTTRCDGERLRACAADGTAESVTDCAATGGWCNDSTLACAPQVCTPGGPVCRDGDVQQCSARGSAWETVRDCLDVGSAAGTCLFPCGDGVLDAGEQCDLGDANGPAATCTTECLVNREVLCAGVADEFCVLLPADGSTVTPPLPATVPEMPLDLGWLVDVTGSNNGLVDGLANGWTTTIGPLLRSREPDHAEALGVFQGFLCDPNGPDIPPFQLSQRVSTSDAHINLAMSGLAGISLGSAREESIVEAIHEASTGLGVDLPACGSTLVPAFDPAFARIAGVQDGAIGGMGFREGSFRVLAALSEAASGGRRVNVDGVGVTREEAFAPEHAICGLLGYGQAREVTWGLASSSATRFRTMLGWACLGSSCLPLPDPADETECSAEEFLGRVVCYGRIEECDDGAANADSADRCRTDCRVPACNDGIVDSGEACDGTFPYFNNGIACRADCTVPRCGDGILDTIRGEACDDGGTTNGDGCSEFCGREAGLGGAGVIIGHDFYARTPEADRLIGNAVALAGTGPLNIVGYTQFADLAGSDNEPANTDAAIRAMGPLLGYTPTITRASTVGPLTAALATADVLVLYEAELASTGVSLRFGEDNAELLVDFVSAGGVIITLEYSGRASETLEGAGLIPYMSSRQLGVASTLTVVAPSHPLAAGLPSNYASPDGSLGLTVPTPFAGEVVVADAAGRGVVLYFDF